MYNCVLESVPFWKEKVPSKKVAIEYDGYLWHKNRTKHDLDKNQKCLNDGIKLYRIREGLHRLNDSSLDYVVHKTQKDLSFVLEKVLSEIIGMSILVDLNRDAIAIENLRELTEKENSLLFSNPEIAKEWNYEKNGNLKPEHLVKEAVESIIYDESESEFQGAIGERLDLYLTVERTIELDGSYGRSTMHIMRDDCGNLFVWTTASKSWSAGTEHHIKGTVKDHRKYKNECQTVLTRCLEVK